MTCPSLAWLRRTDNSSEKIPSLTHVQTLFKGMLRRTLHDARWLSTSTSGVEGRLTTLPTTPPHHLIPGQTKNLFSTTLQHLYYRTHHFSEIVARRISSDPKLFFIILIHKLLYPILRLFCIFDNLFSGWRWPIPQWLPRFALSSATLLRYWFAT